MHTWLIRIARPTFQHSIRLIIIQNPLECERLTINFGRKSLSRPFFCCIHTLKWWFIVRLDRPVDSISRWKTAHQTNKSQTNILMTTTTSQQQPRDHSNMFVNKNRFDSSPWTSSASPSPVPQVAVDKCIPDGSTDAVVSFEIACLSVPKSKPPRLHSSRQ